MSTGKTVGLMLNPEDTDSSVIGYVGDPHLVRNDYSPYTWEVCVNGRLTLSDCNRIISWAIVDSEYVEDSDSRHTYFDVDKIDNAIDALTDLKALMVKANAKIPKLEKERDARNTAIKEARKP